MKKQLVIIGFVVLLLITWLSGCQGPVQIIEARKLSGGYSNSVEMTEQQMKNFPHLKEAILTNKTVIVESPSEEMSKLRGILEFFNTEIIYYQNEYYEIRLRYGD
jgi:hypothetical protein